MIAANFREAWWGPIVAVVPFIATSLCLSLGCVILTRSSFGWFLWLTRTLSHLFSPALLPHICWPPRELDTEGWHSQRERPGRTRYITLPLKCWRSWSKPAVISLSKPLMLNASHAPLLKRPRPQKLNFRKIHFHDGNSRLLTALVLKFAGAHWGAVALLTSYLMLNTWAG